MSGKKHGLQDRYKKLRMGGMMYYKTGALSDKQKAIAAKAPPANKIDGKDFAVLRAEKAKDRGMGLQDEKMKPGKVMKARVGRSIERKKSNLVKKTPLRDFIKDTLEGKYMDKNRGTAEPLNFEKYKRIKKGNKGLHAEKKKDEKIFMVIGGKEFEVKNDMSKLPKGLRKDTTTGFGKNIKKIKDE